MRHLQEPPLRAPHVVVTSFKPNGQKHLSSLRCAWEGLREAWRTERHLRFHSFAAFVVIVVGTWCHLALVEWLWVVFAIGLVFFAELMNTAIEQTVDLVVGHRPDPLARQVKDVAAGCVLVAAMISVAVGVLTFGPYFIGG